jgi:hypothetical protein
MPKDQRLYGKFTLDFPDHPKIAILSDAAFRCLVEATLWSRKQERDGLLARRYAVAKWGVEVLQELCCNDDTNPSLIEREEGWWIHDYAEHQETKADIEDRRERNRVNGQKGGLAKAKRGGKRAAKQPASDSVSENVAEKEEHSSEVTTDVVTSSTRKRKSRRTPLDDSFYPTSVSTNKIREEFPGVTNDDLNYQHRKFIDHAIQNNRLCAGERGWNAAWCNWMRTADERRELRRGVSNVTAFERKKAANGAVYQSLGESPLSELT